MINNLNEQNFKLTRKSNEPTFCGAYKIEHIKTGKLYFGSTNDLYERKFRHNRLLKKNIHDNKNLQEVYNNDSNIKFSFWLTNTREEAYDAEQELLDKYKDSCLLLNISKNARKASLGTQVSQETRNKIGLAHKGKKLSEEHIEKIRLSNLGLKRSKETSKNLSIAGKLKYSNPEYAEKMKNLRKGLIHSNETKLKMSLSHKEKGFSKERLENLIIRNKSRTTKILINGIEYFGIQDAILKTGLSYHNVRKFIIR